MPNVLVTGGAGFIGSHVAERFLRAGYAVTILDDFSSGRRENVPAGATVRELDIRAPEAAALVRDGGFDVLAHLAAQIDVRRSVADPVFDSAVNIQGTLNLLEAVRAGSPRTRVVFSSTGGALYGEFDPPPSAERARTACPNGALSEDGWSSTATTSRYVPEGKGSTMFFVPNRGWMPPSRKSSPSSPPILVAVLTSPSGPAA